MNLPSVHERKGGQYVYAFLPSFFTLFFSILFCPAYLMSNDTNGNDFFLQAEHALMEGDSAQANFIYRYLIAEDTKPEIKSLSHLRLFAKSTGQSKLEMLSGLNEEDSLLLKFIASDKVWERKTKSKGTINHDGSYHSNFLAVFENLNRILNINAVNSSSLYIQETDFVKSLMDEAIAFQNEYLKEESHSIIHQQATLALLSFLHQAVIDHLFLSKLSIQNFKEHSFFTDYKKHLFLLELNSIKTTFFSEQFHLHPNLLSEQRLVESYDIHFFLQNQIFQKGLFNAKRKKQIRNKFNVQEQAIIFYHDQYCLTQNQVWMQKILTVMENIKASLFTTKNMYYDSKDLLKDLGRNVIAEIERREYTPPLFNNEFDQLNYIKQQINTAQHYQYFYNIHQQRRKKTEGIKFEKIKSICQNSRAGKTAVVNFFDSKNYLFILLIDGNTEALNIIPKTQNDRFQMALQYLKNTFSDPAQAMNANKTSLRNFQTTSHSIYQSVLAPLFEKNIPSQIVIIPDGLFNYIPFEAFVLDPPSSKNSETNYLVQNAAVRYYPNLKLFSEQEQFPESTLAIQQFKAYAPKYNSPNSLYKTDKQLPELPGSQLEVKTIRNQFQSKKIDFSPTPFENSKTIHQPNQLLHLAMHATSAFKYREEPGLIFSNDQKDILYLHHIARLPKNPSVVILSACDTGLGKYTIGEGLKSIGQQFLQTGTQSTIQNLNKAADVSSTQLIVGFYKSLKKQKLSHQALQKSKVDFLEKADAFYAHPYFWSGLVAYGQPFEIQ